MKSCFVFTLSTLLACGLSADTENSVILDYDYIAAGFVHNEYDANLEADGGIVQVSAMFSDDFGFRLDAPILDIDGSDDTAWSLSPSIFYVGKVTEKLHLVPRLGLNHSMLGEQNSTEIVLGLDVNFAVAEKVQLGVGFEHQENTNRNSNRNLISNVDNYQTIYASGKIAVSESVGIGARITTASESLDLGFIIGAELHF
jgi:hypothetical protein